MGRISLGGLSSGMDTDNMIKELMKAHSMKAERYKKKNIEMSYRQEEWKKLNGKIYSFYNKELTNFRVKSNILKHKVNIANSSIADISTQSNTQKGSHELEVLQLATSARTASQKLLSDDGKAITENTTMADMGLNNKELKITYQSENGPEEITVIAEGTDTLGKFISKVRDASKGKIELEGNADIKNGYLFLASKNTGEKQSFRLSGEVATRLGFSSEEIKGTSAKYRYNSMPEIFESETNEIEVNGIKAKLKSIGKTEFSVEKDVDAAYKHVIDFFKQFNVLVKDLQDKVNVVIPRSQRDMQPLLDEEKKGLSEADVKKVEETLRGRVFKGDRNIKGLLQDMRTIFTNTAVEGNGKYNALSSLGIATGEFNQGTGALLFVDGDSELGGKRGDLTNKLRQALEDDPEAVAEVLSSLSQKLSEKMAEKMKSTTLRSYMSFYDDKAMKAEYQTVEKRISQMEERLLALEERYRKQFAAMEKALAKSNSTSGWLSAQFSKM